MTAPRRPLRILYSGTRRGVGIQTVALATIDWLASRGLFVGSVHPRPVAVHGGASGVDSEVDQMARNWGWTVEAHPADWDAHGRAAGPIRNTHVASLGGDVLLAFPVGESRGTRHMMAVAERAGITVVDCAAAVQR